MKTSVLTSIEDLIEILRAAGLSMADIAPSLGLSQQGLSARLNGGDLDGASALALLKAAEGVAVDRLAALRRAINATELE
jgi:transcriptional regulator with XRE-family HTH domain